MFSNIVDVINKIESKYDVESIYYGDIPIWPYIRYEIFARYNEGETVHYASDGSSSIVRMAKRAIVAARRILGTKKQSIRKKYKAVLFTDTMETRKVNGKNIDKIANEIYKMYEDNLLIVYSEKQAKEKAFSRFVPVDYLNTQISVRSHGIVVNQDLLKGSTIVDSICEELGIEYKLLTSVRLIIASMQYYDELWKRVSPEIVFVNCYYGDVRKLAAIQSAKNLGIATVELQHGLITREHLAYISDKRIERRPYPEYLFSFGELYKRFISTAIYDEEKIIAVGSYYIDYVRSNSSKLSEEIKLELGEATKNKIVVVIAGQEPFDRHTLLFVNEILGLDEELLFVFVPRVQHVYHNEYQCERLIIRSDLDIYKCICAADVLMTVTSTTALEALALGKSVLLYNQDNLSAGVIYPLVQNYTNVRMVENPKDASKQIHDLYRLNSETSSCADDLFANNHKCLLKNAIQYVLDNKI